MNLIAWLAVLIVTIILLALGFLTLVAYAGRKMADAVEEHDL